MTFLQDTLTTQEQQVIDFYRAHPLSDWEDCAQALGIKDFDALNISINLEMRHILMSREEIFTIRCFKVREI